MIKTYMKPRAIKSKAIKVRVYKKKPIVAVRTEVNHDFLKYIKVVRAWVRHKHGLSIEDFEMLCYLYSEQIFDTGLKVFFLENRKRRDLFLRPFESCR